MANKYYVEVTDLFCGELNYSYVNRFHVRAKSPLGAINKLARHYGLHFRKYYGDADIDQAVYHSTSKLTGVTMELLDPDLIDHRTNSYCEQL